MSNKVYRPTAGDKKLEAMASNAKASADLIKEKTKDKLCLIGVSGQGIERTFITDVVCEQPPFVCIRCCVDNIDDGLYIDMRQVIIYKVYTEEETAKYVEMRRASIAEEMKKQEVMRKGNPTPANVLSPDSFKA